MILINSIHSKGQNAQDTILINAGMDTIKLERHRPIHGEFGGTIEKINIYRLPIGPPHACGLADTSHFICSQLFGDYVLRENISDSIVQFVEVKNIFIEGEILELITSAILELEKNPAYLWNEYITLSHVGSPVFIIKMESGRRTLFEIRTPICRGGWLAFDELRKKITLANKK